MNKCFFVFGLILSFNLNAANTCGDDLGNNCWDCGKTVSDSCTARLDPDTKALTITGDGYMKNYFGYSTKAFEQGETPAPWGGAILSVDISGVKSIGTFAFYNSYYMSDATIPASVESIGVGAFQSTSLTNLTLEDNSNLQSIGSGAFNDIPLSDIKLPETVSYIGNNAFNMSGIDTLFLPDSLFEKGVKGMTNKALSDVSHIYCPSTSQAQCEAYLNTAEFWENGVYYPVKEKVTADYYQVDGGVYILDDVQYTSFADMQRGINPCEDDLIVCKRSVLEAKGVCSGDGCDVFLESDGKYMMKFGGKTYQSINDLLKGNYDKRRIYTIEEANFVAGPVNRVSIRYK
ncbi:MAG: leucine-rich repeat domain-containing protein [Alphaproteobacteria bacterium]|nr:leucine-rich repeat domain-containing protein [Alphaproteobacteria bacterium]